MEYLLDTVDTILVIVLVVIPITVVLLSISMRNERDDD